MATRITRREFIEATTLTAAGVAAASVHAGAAAALPTRAFGRTGLQVTCLAFGCGSRFLMYEEEATALDVLNGAIDQGIRYLDTAIAYGNGESERRVGQVMLGPPISISSTRLSNGVSGLAAARSNG